MVVLAVIGIVIVVAIVFFFAGGLNLITIHQRTLTIDRPVYLDVSKQGSHFLVYGKDGQIVELERQWWAWGDNIDLLRGKVDGQVGKTVTFECFGVRLDMFYWYSNCYREVNVQ